MTDVVISLDPGPSSSEDIALSDVDSTLQLVFQFLESNGLSSTASALLAETNLQPVLERTNDPILLRIIRNASHNIRVSKPAAAETYSPVSTFSKPLSPPLSPLTPITPFPSSPTSPLPPLSAESIKLDQTEEPEKPETPQVLYDTDGSVRAISLPQLANSLCDLVVDEKLMHVFLMTAPVVASADKIVALLQTKYLSGDELVRTRVSELLSLWLRASPPAPAEVIEYSQSLTNVLHRDGLVKESVNLSNSLVACMTQTLLCGYTAPVITDPPRIFSRRDPSSITFDCVDVEELAQTICASDHEIFSRISPAELLDNAWQRPETKRQCRAIKSTFARSNSIMAWAAHTILSKPTAQDRLLTIRKFGDLLRQLRTLKDYSALTAIANALSSGAVSRLKKMWEAVDTNTKAIIEDVKNLCSQNRNYRNYRAEITAAQPPAVPFMGVWFQDITLIAEGNPRNISGLINWSRRSLTSNVLDEVARFQAKRYDLSVNLYLLNMVLRTPKVAGSTLMEMSYKIEPRE